MQLKPQTQGTEAHYPKRQGRSFKLASRWIRRVGTAIAASAAIWITGSLTIGCGGVIMQPEYFVCEDELPNYASSLDITGSYSGFTCSSGNRAMAFIDVETSETVHVWLTGSSDCGAYADVIAPDGVTVATIESETPGSEIELTPGRWIIAIDHDGSCDNSDEFHFHIDPSEG